MNTYILRAADPAAYPPSDYRCVVGLGSDDLRILAEEDPTLPGDSLAGGFDHGGNPVTEIDQALYNEIVPLCNHADGSATDVLRGGYVDGWRQEALGDTDADHVTRLYPIDNQPFDLEVRHKLFDDPAHPQVNGWGFRVEMIGEASTRDPSARSTGAYTDDTFETAIWSNVGAFILGPSEWQVDTNGDPIDVWYQESWDAHRPDEKPTWYVAVLKGPVMEGHAILPQEQDSVRYLFWEHTQGQEGGEVPDWVQPTGAHDSYSLGDHVMHNGSEWVSTHDGPNSWEPGVYGWDQV